MARRIMLEWPSEGIAVSASLLEVEEPELCGLLWENLREPLRMSVGTLSPQARSSAPRPDHQGAP